MKSILNGVPIISNITLISADNMIKNNSYTYPCHRYGRVFSYRFISVIGGLVLLQSCSVNDKNQEAPNIVIILTDDLGYGDLSCLNPASKIKTPNIDLIARSGITFRDAHSSSAVSTPTRYGILTGRYNWRSDLKSSVLDGYSRALIPESRTTVAGMLQSRGYETACFGKWHLGWDWNSIDKGKDSIDFSKPITRGPTTSGFNYFYGFSGSLDMPPYVYVENDLPTSVPDRLTVGNTSPVGDPDYDGSFWREGPTGSDFDFADCTPNLFRRAGKYIEEHSKSEKPFFLYLALPSPHTPILPDLEFKGSSGLNPYADFVMQIDSEVGKLMKIIEESGEEANTIVIFTSDNGCSPWADIDALKEKGHNPSHIFRGHKADLYEGGHHIPCLLRWPARISKPFEVKQTICLIDFMATFAAISAYNLADNEAEDSYNLLPAILNSDYKNVIREATVHHSINGNFSIRKGEWKLLLSPGSGGWSSPRPGEEETGLPPVQLYNLDIDPGEKVNLYDKYPDIVIGLTDLLRKYIEDGRSTPGEPKKNDGLYPWKQVESIVLN
jgi:arylsulfatase A-like enzyme